MPDEAGRFRLAILGSRDFTPDDDVFRAIERMQTRHPEGVVVITGDGKGVPLVAWQIAAMMEVPYVVEKTEWPVEDEDIGLHEKVAARSDVNIRVIAQADALLAFFHPGPSSDLAMTSSGTMNALHQATSRGIPVYAFHEGKWTAGRAPSAPELPPDGWVVPKGWRASGRSSTCGSRIREGCGAEILWAENPKGRKAPLNPDGTSHFETCPVPLRRIRNG
jgi:hypothetical protein